MDLLSTFNIHISYSTCLMLELIKKNEFVRMQLVYVGKMYSIDYCLHLLKRSKKLQYESFVELNRYP